jgi:hypothetical protein
MYCWLREARLSRCWRVFSGEGSSTTVRGLWLEVVVLMVFWFWAVFSGQCLVGGRARCALCACIVRKHSWENESGDIRK